MTPVLTIDLVERETELRAVDGVLEASRNGTGSTLVLDAPAGLGKSAILDAAVRAARGDGMIVLQARGDVLGRHVPHAALQQLCSRAAQELRALGDAEVSGSPAAQLFAAIGMDSIGDPITPGQVATGLWWLLELLAERHETAVLVVVDDLHLVDRCSMEALAFVASRVDTMRCSMLVAQRHGEPCIDEASAARLRHAAATRTLGLDLLTVGGSMRLARSIDPTLHDDVIRAAHDSTGGNPLLLAEVVRHIDDDVPPRVLDHVRLRLSRCSAGASEVAAATAALGPWATVARVAEVAGTRVDGTESLFDELADAGIVVRRDDRYVFRHPLLGAAVLETTVDDGQRRRLALRAANAIAAGGADVTAVASLLLDAPIAGDASTSARLVDGAVAALAAGAPDDAVRFVERAIAEPIADAPARAEAWLLASRARQSTRDWHGAIDASNAALELTADPSDRSELRATIANLHIGASDIVGAMREFEAAAREIEHVPGAATRFVELRASGQAFGRFLGLASDQEDPLADVLPDDPADDTHEHRILLANVAMAHVFANEDAARIRRLSTRALAGTTLLRESGVDAPLLFTAMAPLTWTDDYDTVLPALDAAIAHARERGSVLGHATAMSSRGGTLWRRGDLLRAVADLEASIEARHDGWTAYLPFVGYCAARAHLDLGDTDAVHAVVRAAISGDDLASWGPIEPFAHAALGIAQVARDEPARALEHMLDAVAAADRQRSSAIAIAEWRFEAVELAALLGRHDEVHDLAVGTLDQARRLGAPRPLGMALRGMAAITADASARRRLLDEAVNVLRDGGVQIELARTLMACGRDSGSRTDLEQAHEIAAACGGRRIIEQLASLGVATSASVQHDVLTPGELRVAELAASGMINREIAQSLFVTVKAVEWHLSNCYRKLRISGRRELARALAAR